jgi:hypothetical protein
MVVVMMAGVFTLMYAYFLSMGDSLSFEQVRPEATHDMGGWSDTRLLQADMPHIRRWLVLTLMEQTVL